MRSSFLSCMLGRVAFCCVLTLGICTLHIRDGHAAAVKKVLVLFPEEAWSAPAYQMIYNAIKSVFDETLKIAVVAGTGMVDEYLLSLFHDVFKDYVGKLELIDWKADDDNKLTLPVGLGIGKLVKIGGLPIQFIAEGQYAVIGPDDFGQEWNIQFTVTPVLPSLIKDPIFS